MRKIWLRHLHFGYLVWILRVAIDRIEKEVQGSITGCLALWLIRTTEETGDRIVLVPMIANVSVREMISAGLPVSIRTEFYLRPAVDYVPGTTKAITDRGQLRVVKVVQRCTSALRLDLVPVMPIQLDRESIDHLLRSRNLGWTDNGPSILQQLLPNDQRILILEMPWVSRTSSGIYLHSKSICY